uniref:Uncharacterized protein n=1 Tax=Anguilla anguilla TaxID=7936 RepID=A0A0E9XKK0_ANGAN
MYLKNQFICGVVCVHQKSLFLFRKYPDCKLSNVRALLGSESSCKPLYKYGKELWQLKKLSRPFESACIALVLVMIAAELPVPVF